jgi:hypothetical protein
MYLVIGLILVLIFSEIHNDSVIDLEIKEAIKIIK